MAGTARRERARGLGLKSDAVAQFEAVDISGANYTPSVPFGAIYVGVAGDVVVVSVDGQDTVTMKNLAAGVWHLVKGKTIVKVNTTATNMLVGW